MSNFLVSNVIEAEMRFKEGICKHTNKSLKFGRSCMLVWICGPIIFGNIGYSEPLQNWICSRVRGKRFVKELWNLVLSILEALTGSNLPLNQNTQKKKEEEKSVSSSEFCSKWSESQEGCSIL